jgi:hypothetical protein
MAMINNYGGTYRFLNSTECWPNMMILMIHVCSFTLRTQTIKTRPSQEVAQLDFFGPWQRERKIELSLVAMILKKPDGNNNTNNRMGKCVGQQLVCLR